MERGKLDCESGRVFLCAFPADGEGGAAHGCQRAVMWKQACFLSYFT